MLRILLIEPASAERAELRKVLQSLEDICIVAEADSLASAGPLLQRETYDVAFIATDFRDGSGFELADLVRGGRAVFLASDREQAARAFEANALDYLIKPVQQQRLTGTLARVRPTAIPINESRAPFPLHLRMDNRLKLELGVAVADLSAIVAQENYSIVHLGDGTKTMVRRSLKAWLAVLPSERFLRVHRSTVVNVAYVRDLRRDGPKAFSLGVQGLGDRVPVGREAWQTLRERLSRQVRG